MIIILIIQRKLGCWCIYKSAVSHLSQKQTQYTFTNSLYTHTHTHTYKLYIYSNILHLYTYRHALIQNKNTHTHTLIHSFHSFTDAHFTFIKHTVGTGCRLSIVGAHLGMMFKFASAQLSPFATIKRRNEGREVERE
jgi:hypothetical protein